MVNGWLSMEAVRDSNSAIPSPDLDNNFSRFLMSGSRVVQSSTFQSVGSGVDMSASNCKSMKNKRKSLSSYLTANR